MNNHTNPKQTVNGKRIALVAPTDRSIWSFRRGLIERLRDEGASVTVICEAGPWVARIEAAGATVIGLPMARFINPLGDVRYLLGLIRILRRGNFDLVHTFTIKPNVFGSLAARIARVPTVVALVEGFGFLYGEGTAVRDRIRRWFFFRLYWFGFSLCDRACFINEDDKNEMIAAGAIDTEQVVFIRSVGVDTKQYQPIRDETKLEGLRAELGLTDAHKVVVFASRMSWSKGVREVVEAAAILAKSDPTIVFLLIGEVQPGSPQSVDVSYLKSSETPNLRWLGFREDVRELMQLSAVVIQPSYYREGVPRTILEALAVGKPVVATDWVGCREAVRNNWNGFLVPIKDSGALANAIGSVLSNQELAGVFGRNSRAWAEDEFDERRIVSRVISELYQMTCSSALS